MLESNCKLCEAVIDSVKEERLLYNTPLFENQTFTILPSVGPLIAGQAIIVSKEHQLNYFSMDTIKRANLNPLVDYTIRILGNNVLFAEHGSQNEQSGGSCIDHTHIHVIPGFESYVDILDNLLPIYLEDFDSKSLHKITDIDFPYILTFNFRGRGRIYKAYNAHSQMIRQAICSKEKRTDGDWKKIQNNMIIEQTVDIWQKK